MSAARSLTLAGTRDHRPAVLPLGRTRRDPARSRQRRLCRARHDRGAAADAAGADPARRRHHPAAAGHPGRDLGVDLSPHLERVESEGADSRRDHRHGRRHRCLQATSPTRRSRLRAASSVFPSCSTAGSAGGCGRTFCAPPKTPAGRTRSSACSGDRSRASCRCSSTSARRRIRSTSCRSGSRSSRSSARR